MPEEELEKRIRTLEIRGATLLGSITTLAVCCVAFLGFEYYRIPHQVQEQVEDKIGEQTRFKIKEALDNADRLESKLLNMEGRKAQIIDVKDGQIVHPPDGTEKGDWAAFISPSDIGLVEEKSEGDNALLVFHSSLTETEMGWRADVTYRFKYGSGTIVKDIPGNAKVLLIPTLNLQSFNRTDSAGAKTRAVD
jgi:hypothetical protein